MKPATDIQLTIVRMIADDTLLCEPETREALAAVLSELAALREENKPLRGLRDAVVDAALAACKETTAKQLANKETT